MTEFIIIGSTIAAFLGGMLATEAYKTLEYIYHERRARISQEIRFFGRPLKRKERKVMKKTWKMQQMSAAVGPSVLNETRGRIPEVRRRPVPGNTYSNGMPPPPPEFNPKPYSTESEGTLIYDGLSTPNII
ncbi:hypothetical protein TWF281_006151 [Arthrobotrys megalospora]